MHVLAESALFAFADFEDPAFQAVTFLNFRFQRGHRPLQFVGALQHAVFQLPVEGANFLLGPLALGNIFEDGIDFGGVILAGRNEGHSVNVDPSVNAQLRIEYTHDDIADDLAGLQRHHRRMF